MLVELKRVNSYGTETGANIGINPISVGALHGSNQHSEVSLVRLHDGRGYLVRGDYDFIKSQLPGVSLVEFDRVDNTGRTVGRSKIGINPEAVGTVHDSLTNPGTSVVRLFDGRGYLVLGDYTDVIGRLRGEEPEPSDRNGGIRLVADSSRDPNRNVHELEDSEIEDDDEDDEDDED